jgi:hypothetical protein
MLLIDRYPLRERYLYIQVLDRYSIFITLVAYWLHDACALPSVPSDD